MQPRTLCELMQLHDPNDAAADFQRKFCGSYVATDSGIAYVSKIHPSFIGIEGVALLWYGQDYKVVDLSGEVELDTLFPQTGLFTHKGKLCSSLRIPSRQYRRSVSIDSWHHTDIFHDLVGLLRYVNCPLYSGTPKSYKEVLASLEVLESACHPTYLSWGSPLPELHSGYAINKDWGVTRNPANFDQIVVWCGEAPVATGNYDKLTLRNEVLLQELQDFIARESISVRLV